MRCLLHLRSISIIIFLLGIIYLKPDKTQSSNLTSLVSDCLQHSQPCLDGVSDY